jgi:hypothetical protein
MSPTVKIMSKIALQRQTGASYEDNAMFVVPATGFSFKSKPSFIKDESYDGSGFEALPLQGVLDVEGNMSFLVGANSFLSTLIVCALPSATTKQLSVCRKDGVGYRQYSNVFIKKLSLSGKVNDTIKGEVELFGTSAEASGAWPVAAPTMFGTPLKFHDLSGSGYFRIGDQSDALTSGDNYSIEDFKIDLTTGYESQHDNTRMSLAATGYMVQPTVEVSVKFSRHENDTIKNWSENATHLQAEMQFGTGSGSMNIKFPNFVIQHEITDDDIARQSVTFLTGRNGSGSNYANPYMTVNDPISFTITL